MFTLTLFTALIVNAPQSEIVTAKRFDWNEFHYIDSKPKPKFIRPVITSDNLTTDRLPVYR